MNQTREHRETEHRARPCDLITNERSEECQVIFTYSPTMGLIKTFQGFYLHIMEMPRHIFVLRKKIKIVKPENPHRT